MTTPSALAGIRVIDVTTSRAELAGRVLADLGAEVIKVEPPGGCDARTLPPFANADDSLYWASVGVGKRSVVLDLARPDDLATLKTLIDSADVLVESFDPGVMDRYGLGFAALAQRNPGLVYASVTPFGQSGPAAATPAIDLTIEAGGGLVGLQGDGDRPPIAIGLPQASFHGGVQAAADILIALYERNRSGLGQHLDVSMQAAIVWTLMNATGYPANTGGNPPGTSEFRNDARPTLVPGMRAPRITSCRDGYVIIGTYQPGIGERTLDGMIRWLTDEGAAPAALPRRSWLQYMTELTTGALSVDDFNCAYDAMCDFVGAKTKRWLLDGALERKLLLAPIYDIADLRADPQLAARGYWTDVGGVIHPGPFARLSATPIKMDRPAPRLGVDQSVLHQARAVSHDARHLVNSAAAGGAGTLANASVSDGAVDPAAVIPVPGTAVNSVSGVRAQGAQGARHVMPPGARAQVSFGARHQVTIPVSEGARHQVTTPVSEGARHQATTPVSDGAGAVNTRDGVFAGLKVADFAWVGVGPIISKTLADHGATVIHVESEVKTDLLRSLPPFKNAEPGINRSQFFANFNTSKQGLRLELTDAGDLALARKLADWADVVVESFTPGTMARYGLDYATLSTHRSDLVMLSTCMRGQTGPERHYTGFGNQGAALAGLAAITGWPDRAPVGPWGAYTDFITPRYGVAALAAALLHRDATGQGQYIDVSQIEAGIHFQAPLVLDYTVNGRVATARGNVSDYACPHGTYRTCGEERYIAIGVTTREQWNALSRLVPFSLSAASLGELVARIAHRDVIERELAAWCADQEAFELAKRLQGAGVPAYVVLRPTDLFEDAQLRHRQFFVTLDHPVMGPTPYDGFVTLYSRTPPRLRSPAPLLGEHSAEIRRWLDL